MTRQGYSSGKSALARDPAALLARGYTARYIGAVLPKNKVSILSNEEIEKDLRHMMAYCDAATRYHQLTYANTNRISVQAEIKQHPQDAHNHVLPVRIDPEEEKRVAALQKRIQRAELLREELEQQYVALRAHYVMTTQQLSQKQNDKTIQFLQQAVKNAAISTGLLRARLQMARDVRACLQYRKQALAAADLDPNSTGSIALAPPVTDRSPTTAGGDPLPAAWNVVEEEWKKLVQSASPVVIKKGGKKNASSSSSTGAASASVLPWICATEPATPRGVSQYVSTVSTAPEKSLAVQTSACFGSSKDSMLWLENNLPDLVDDYGEDVIETSEFAVEKMQDEVAILEQELTKERSMNQVILTDTGRARVSQDEWVAMISLVRQETEAVLHRHNILLESDEVMEAAVVMAAERGHDNDGEGDEAVKGGSAEAEDAIDGEEQDAVAGTSLEPVDEANDGDDEGTAEDGDDHDDWGASAGAGKRGPTTEVPETESRKRRKL